MLTNVAVTEDHRNIRAVFPPLPNDIKGADANVPNIELIDQWPELPDISVHCDNVVSYIAGFVVLLCVKENLRMFCFLVITRR